MRKKIIVAEIVLIAFFVLLGALPLTNSGGVNASFLAYSFGGFATGEDMSIPIESTPLFLINGLLLFALLFCSISTLIKENEGLMIAKLPLSFAFLFLYFFNTSSFFVTYGCDVLPTFYFLATISAGILFSSILNLMGKSAEIKAKKPNSSIVFLISLVAFASIFLPFVLSDSDDSVLILITAAFGSLDKHLIPNSLLLLYISLCAASFLAHIAVLVRGDVSNESYKAIGWLDVVLAVYSLMSATIFFSFSDPDSEYVFIGGSIISFIAYLILCVLDFLFVKKDAETGAVEEQHDSFSGLEDFASSLKRVFASLYTRIKYSVGFRSAYEDIEKSKELKSKPISNILSIVSFIYILLMFVVFFTPAIYYSHPIIYYALMFNFELEFPAPFILLILTICLLIYKLVFTTSKNILINLIPSLLFIACGIFILLTPSSYSFSLSVLDVLTSEFFRFLPLTIFAFLTFMIAIADGASAILLRYEHKKEGVVPVKTTKDIKPSKNKVRDHSFVKDLKYAFGVRNIYPDLIKTRAISSKRLFNTLDLVSLITLVVLSLFMFLPVLEVQSYHSILPLNLNLFSLSFLETSFNPIPFIAAISILVALTAKLLVSKTCKLAPNLLPSLLLLVSSVFTILSVALPIINFDDTYYTSVYVALPAFVIIAMAIISSIVNALYSILLFNNVKDAIKEEKRSNPSIKGKKIGSHLIKNARYAFGYRKDFPEIEKSKLIASKPFANILDLASLYSMTLLLVLIFFPVLEIKPNFRPTMNLNYFSLMALESQFDPIPLVAILLIFVSFAIKVFTSKTKRTFINFLPSVTLLVSIPFLIIPLAMKIVRFDDSKYSSVYLTTFAFVFIAAVALVSLLNATYTFYFRSKMRNGEKNE